MSARLEIEAVPGVEGQAAVVWAMPSRVTNPIALEPET